MLRKKGITFVIILTALIISLSFILTDSWIKKSIENSGSSIAGAKVELDGFNISLFGLYVKWERLQVTDSQHTMKNLFETGPCQLDFEFWPLLSKKFIVENFTVSGIQTNTDRETDGKLIQKPEKISQDENIEQRSASRSSEPKQSEFSGFAKNANIDSVLKIADLRSAAKIDSLYKAYNNVYQKWEVRLSESDPLPELKEVEQQIKNIDVDNLKDLKKIAKALEQSAAAKKSIDKISKDFRSLQKDFSGEFDSAQSGLGQVDNWLEADYRNTTNLLQIPELSASNIGKLIFGKTVASKIQTYLDYIQTGRKYTSKLASGKPKEEKPLRLKGQDIYFFNPNARPDFWIKNILLSGTTNDRLELKGTASNLVSDQKLIGQPSILHLSGGKEKSSNLKIDGKLDYLTDIPQETFAIEWSGFSLAGQKLADSPFLPEKVKSGSGNITAKLDLSGAEIKSRIDFTAQNLVFEQGQPGKTEFDKIVKDILQNTNVINFKAKISGTKKDLKYTLDSNLDDIFMKNLKDRFGKELDSVKDKIKKQIEQQTAGQRAKLDKLIKENETKLRAQFAKYETAVETQMQKIESKKKEIDKKKKKLSKDAANKLKGLF